jgi:hypothetical protein
LNAEREQESAGNVVKEDTTKPNALELDVRLVKNRAYQHGIVVEILEAPREMGGDE